MRADDLGEPGPASFGVPGSSKHRRILIVCCHVQCCLSFWNFPILLPILSHFLVSRRAESEQNAITKAHTILAVPSAPQVDTLIRETGSADSLGRLLRQRVC